MNSLLATLILCSIAVHSGPARAGQNTEAIHLTLGESHILKGHGKIWIEKAKIIKAKTSYGRVELIGRSPGSSLVLWKGQSFEVFVVTPSHTRTRPSLATAAARSLGLSLSRKASRHQIHGELIRFQDWKNLAAACPEDSCEYDFLAEVPEERRQKFEMEFAAELKKQGLSPQKILWKKPRTLLIPPKDPQKPRLERIAQAYGLRILEDPTRVAAAPMVRIKITVAEINKNEAEKLGVNWQQNFSAKILPYWSTADTSLSAQLNLLEQKGLAKNLATPTVLCYSGKEAEFFAGGEYPIRIVSGSVREVRWKPYGIILKFNPKADYLGRMDLGISTEVSELDGSVATEGLPAVKVNRIKSFLSLEKAQTVVLSGLLKESRSQSRDGLAGLSQIPILGALFSSENYRQQRSELFVFVSPEVLGEDSVEPVGNQAPEHLGAAQGWWSE